MSILQVPVNCTGITTSTSGAQTPSSAKVTITTVEMTDIIQSYNKPSVVSSDITTGAVVVRMSQKITSLTINSHTYAVTAGVSAAMAAADASEFIYEGFHLVL